ncbi:hypothetical protein QQF64_032996 [Cirrhinus molitorella]|uniref:Thyroid hormone receptor associated protein 3 n=1 Tax=Cirrhinus molitorella TaxID=172907 RepID=A0ABR3MSL9_9TELE
MSSGVSRTDWPMKLKPKENKQNKKKKQTDFSESSKKQRSAERQGAEHTHRRRFYKKSLQEIIRSAYEKSPHIQRPAPHGAKNSSRLCRFFDSLVCESSECKSSQQVQKQTKKDHSKQKRTTSHRDHTTFSNSSQGREDFRGSRRSEQITSSRKAATGNKVTPLNFGKVLRLKTIIPSRQSTQPVMMWLVLSSERRG